MDEKIKQAMIDGVLDYLRSAAQRRTGELFGLVDEPHSKGTTDEMMFEERKAARLMLEVIENLDKDLDE